LSANPQVDPELVSGDIAALPAGTGGFFEHCGPNGAPENMTPSPFSFDPRSTPSVTERARFQRRRALALWKWRNYASQDSAFINRLMKADVQIQTIWDVGASNGAWSWIVGRNIPKVRHHLFEPLAGHVEDYAKTLQQHLYAHPNWTLHTSALGERDDAATIFADANNYGSSLVASDYVKDNWRPIIVNVRSCDSLVENDEAPVPDLIKADTQGFELNMLKGAVRMLPKVKALLLESWLTRGYGPDTPLLTELIDWLKPHGFAPVEFADGYQDPSGFYRSVDVFFLRNDVASQAGYVF
jgi:FkbM family methyltransferase